MKPESILRLDIYDIILEGRNKEYSAYDLRKKYNQRLSKAIGVVTISVLMLTLVVVTFFDKHSSSAASARIISEFFDTLAPVHVLLEMQPPSRPSKPMAPAATIKIAMSLIIKDNLIDPIPEIKELDNPIQISLKTSLGDPDLQIEPATENVKNSLNNEKLAELIPKENPHAEQMPGFPEGDEELRRYLLRNLKIPEQSVLPGQSIRGNIQFIIDSEGNVSSIKFENYPGERFKQEILSVMKKMPGWKPGFQDGLKVSVNS